MEKETQEFLKAEEAAQKLVQTLEKLQAEGASYQTASEELDKVRIRLVNLIQSTEEVVKGSREIVGVLKKIGGPEILDRLTGLKEQCGQEFARQSETLDRLIELQEECGQELVIQSRGLKILNRLVMIAIASSATGVVLGIMALVR